MGCELWGFFGVEGLDTRIYGNWGKNLREVTMIGGISPGVQLYLKGPLMTK